MDKRIFLSFIFVILIASFLSAATENNNIQMSNIDWDGALNGVVIHTGSVGMTVNSLLKAATDNSTYGLLLWANGTVMTNVSFSGRFANFSSNNVLNANQDYIFVGENTVNSNNPATNFLDNFSVGIFPVAGTYLTWTKGYISGSNQSNDAATIVAAYITPSAPLPSVTLINPTNKQVIAGNNITFSVIPSSPTDTTSINVSIFGNFSGSWAMNSTNSSSYNNTETNFSIVVPDGYYLWGASINDSGKIETFSNSNYTFLEDTGTVTNFYIPHNATTSSNLTQQFIANLSSGNSLLNTTLYIWNSTKSLINSVIQNVVGNMWVSTKANYMSEVSPTGTITNYSTTGSQLHNTVFCNGSIWTADYSSSTVIQTLLNGTSYQYSPSGSSGDHGITCDNNGFVWESNQNSNSVSQIWTANGSANATYTGTVSTPATINYDGHGAVWTVGLTGAYGVSKIWTNNGTIINFYGTGFQPTDLIYDQNGSVWTANFNPSSVTKVNITDGTMTNFSDIAGSGANDLAANGTYIFVGNYNSNSITVYNENGSVVAIWNGTGVNPQAIALAGSGSLWTANYGDDTVSQLYPNGTIVNYTTIKHQPYGIAADNTVNGNLTQFTQQSVSSNTSLVSGATNTSNWFYTLPSYDNYTWNVLTCDGFNICAFNSSNYTLIISTAPSPTPPVTFSGICNNAETGIGSIGSYLGLIFGIIGLFVVIVILGVGITYFRGSEGSFDPNMMFYLTLGVFGIIVTAIIGIIVIGSVCSIG